MTDVYPKREIVSEPFCNQRDVINKLLIEMQNQPAASFTKMKKRFNKPVNNGPGYLCNQYQQVSRGVSDDFAFDYNKMRHGQEYGQYANLGQYQLQGQYQVSGQGFAQPYLGNQNQMYLPGLNTLFNNNSTDGSSTTSTPILAAESIISGSNSSSSNLNSEPVSDLKNYNFDPFKPLELSKIDLTNSSLGNFESSGSYGGSIWNNSNAVWG